MISFEESVRLVRIRERVRNATLHELRKDGHHKSSEGATNIAFHLPSIFGDEQPWWSVEVYSYVLCPDGRNETWTGKSAAEAISKAEDAIAKWCFSAEMEQFEGQFESQDGNEDSSP